MLRRFWFKFRRDRSKLLTVLDMGCGITAYDLEDARKVLREEVFQVHDEQPVEEIIEDIDVSTLEERHVRPNMGNPAVRGVWFPLL